MLEKDVDVGSDQVLGVVYDDFVCFLVRHLNDLRGSSCA